MWTRGFKGARAPPVRARAADRQLCTVLVSHVGGQDQPRAAHQSVPSANYWQAEWKCTLEQSGCSSSAAATPLLWGAPGAVQVLEWTGAAAVRGPEPGGHLVCSDCRPVAGNEGESALFCCLQKTSSEEEKDKKRPQLLLDKLLTSICLQPSSIWPKWHLFFFISSCPTGRHALLLD